MIVIDASALVEVLLETARGGRVAVRTGEAGITWHAPHLIDVEVLSVLRRLESRGWPALELGRAASLLRAVALTRYDHVLLSPRIWHLRGNLTAYAASYVALAEALAVPLVTCDARLARAPGHAATIEHIA